METLTLPAGQSAALVAEIRAARDRYVDDQVSRQLAHREGDMSRAQIDDAEMSARIRWDRDHPAMARLARTAVRATTDEEVHHAD